MRAACLPPLLCSLLAAPTPVHPAPPRPALTLPDTPFIQETHVPLPRQSSEAANDVRCLVITPDHTLWIGTSEGVFWFDESNHQWRAPRHEIGEGPVFSLAAVGSQVFFAAWNGLHVGSEDGLRHLPLTHGPLAAIAPAHTSPPSSGPPQLWAAGPDGLWMVSLNASRRHPAPISRQVRALLAPTRDELWVATGNGLFHVENGATTLHQGPQSPWSSNLRDLARDRAGRIWAAALGGVYAYQGNRLETVLDAAQGLPHADTRCLAFAPDATLWIGTSGGAARYQDRRWSLRHSRRWLVDDQVQDVAFEPSPDSTYTTWIATPKGVSAIRQQRLSLAQKAAHYHAACESRHVRPPGFVEKCRLHTPGDLSRWEPEDDDNDGGYTAVYLAMESFRYAVTRDPAALANARRAFAALEFLQQVTETPGFLARTVIPADWTRMHDPNQTLSPVEQAERRVEDPREKYVPERWRKSRDGRWLWKGDTSSDEITAHMFGYFWFHELAADTADRSRVAAQVCRIVDHLIDHGYRLVDQDGRPTRWGVWAPDQLNQDPDWANEAGINAVEILSYLKLASHVSGHPRYHEHYRNLLDRHAYRDHVLRPKTTGPASRTHIDDELLAFAWPSLLLLERDTDLRRRYQRGLDQWHTEVAPDESPLFEFLYARLSGSRSSATRTRLRRCVEQLRDQPLDLVRWTVDNRHRDDVRLVRRPEFETLQTDRLLPPSERGTPRSDDNPRRAVQGDGGHTESDGVFWLLPYWMARHFGYIQPPQTTR